MFYARTEPKASAEIVRQLASECAVTLLVSIALAKLLTIKILCHANQAFTTNDVRDRSIKS